MTFQEFKRIEKGMPKGQVERIFQAPGCVTFDDRLGGGYRLLGKQYRQANGRWTQVEYSTVYRASGNILRVDVRRFNRRPYLCNRDY